MSRPPLLWRERQSSRDRQWKVSMSRTARRAYSILRCRRAACAERIRSAGNAHAQPLRRIRKEKHQLGALPRLNFINVVSRKGKACTSRQISSRRERYTILLSTRNLCVERRLIDRLHSRERDAQCLARLVFVERLPSCQRTASLRPGTCAVLPYAAEHALPRQR